jgi:hypothetical protein
MIAVLNKALAKEPSQRYQRTSSFVESLSQTQKLLEPKNQNAVTLTNVDIRPGTIHRKIKPHDCGEKKPTKIDQLGKETINRRFSAGTIIILTIAVVAFSLILTILYFMPATWWCVLTINTLYGCPIN